MSFSARHRNKQKLEDWGECRGAVKKLTCACGSGIGGRPKVVWEPAAVVVHKVSEFKVRFPVLMVMRRAYNEGLYKSWIRHVFPTNGSENALSAECATFCLVFFRSGWYLYSHSASWKQQHSGSASQPGTGWLGTLER